MQIDERERTIAVDTCPEPLEPADGPLMFGGDADDEPWEEFDPDADASALEPLIASFGDLDLEDISTHERWLQSALKALVAPSLRVDGKPGARTVAAIKSFQSAASRLRGGGPALRVDGVAGPGTLAALVALTGVDAPTIREGAVVVPGPPPAATAAVVPGPPPAATALPSSDRAIVVREERVGEAVEYVITADGDEVRFSYWSRDRRDYRPHAVSRYRGAKKGLVSDAQILAAGYSTSELAILRANAQKEAGGTYGAINTWDNQIVSWGMAQFAGHAGTLANLLLDLRDDPRSAAAYDRWFRSQGVDIDEGEYPFGGETRRGVHVVVRDGDAVHRGDRGWEHLRGQPRLIGAFLLAGNDPAIQLGQILFWRRAFLTRAYRKVVGRSHGGGRVSDFLTAERSIAIIVRLYNWMPAHVVKWCDRFLDEMAAANPGRAVHEPRTWDQALEDALVARISEARKASKKGDYEDYALDLGRTRGTFRPGADEDSPKRAV
jgi:hypothetical protein